MRRTKPVFPWELFLVAAAAWVLCGMPGQARLLELLVRADDPWRNDRLAEALRKHPQWRAFTIVAEIESVRDPLNVIPDVHPGEVMTGTYVFDADAADDAADPASGKYRFTSAPLGIVLQVGRHRFGTDSQNADVTIDVGNRAYGDLFSFISLNNICQPELGHGDCTGHVARISWCLHDFTGKAFASDELPRRPLELTNWQSLVGLRIEGTATNQKDGSDDSFLVVARVLRTEPATFRSIR